MLFYKGTQNLICGLPVLARAGAPERPERHFRVNSQATDFKEASQSNLRGFFYGSKGFTDRIFTWVHMALLLCPVRFWQLPTKDMSFNRSYLMRHWPIRNEIKNRVLFEPKVKHPLFAH